MPNHRPYQGIELSKIDSFYESLNLCFVTQIVL